MSLQANIRQWRFSLAYQSKLLGEIFFPRRCAVCHREIEEGCFCASCRNSFWLGRNLPERDSVDVIIFLYRYQNQLQKLIQQVKFEQKSSLLPLLREEAQWGWNKYFSNLSGEYDYLSCIPTSPERRRRRGFDIPQEIFADLVTDKWRPDLLKRIRQTQPLFSMDPALRREEIAGCFSVQENVRGKRILLCDDIYTSGSTMEEAALTLKQAGALKVGAMGFTASKDNW